MICLHCGRRAVDKWYGIFNFGCIDCCISLLLSCYPKKNCVDNEKETKLRVRSMLACIEKFEDAPPRDLVLFYLAERKNKPTAEGAFLPIPPAS